jgi:hypothetical protein
LIIAVVALNTGTWAWSKPQSPAASSATCCSSSGCHSSSAAWPEVADLSPNGRDQHVGHAVSGVVALVMPAVFDLSLYGSLSAHPVAIDRLSFWSALILISAYVGSLIYAFTVQHDLFRPDENRQGDHR